jgi:nucleotide-binding universal stress UspA family protein
VQLLRVLEAGKASTQAPSIDPVDWQIRKAEAGSYLSGLAARMRQSGVEVGTQLREGKPAEQILEFARSWNADLILLSSHGQSGLSPWNVSSVVQHVILHAHSSVMIVRAYQPTSANITGLKYRRILLPLDGSQRAEMPLAFAEALSQKHDSSILIAHVVQQPELPRRTPPSAEDQLLARQLAERNREVALAYLEELRSRLKVRLETKLETSPKVSQSLHRIAEESQADLTILSAHGWAGETHWPYGTVVVSFIVFGSTPLLILQDLPFNGIEPTKAEMAAREKGSH